MSAFIPGQAEPSGDARFAARPDAEPGTFYCAECGEDVELGPNVEAFELSGVACCDLCAEFILEANSQFGVGA